jgi:hypothetical protein
VFILSLSVVARRASACSPGARLSGDPGLVAEVTPVLVERGIDVSPSACRPVAITLQKQKNGRVTVGSSQSADAPSAGREVTDVRTAATVIESWVRSDVEAPLLERRNEDDAELPEGLVAVGRPVRRRTLQVFTMAETGAASDHTDWVGLQIGACVRVGPTCLGARVSLSTVADGPGEWEDAMQRQAAAALASVDVPVPFGSLTLSPGIGFGVGESRTHEEDSADSKRTLGLRGEAHLALSAPISETFSAEFLLSLELARTLEVDATTREALPNDPALLTRIGIGLRYEGP